MSDYENEETLDTSENEIIETIEYDEQIYNHNEYKPNSVLQILNSSAEGKTFIDFHDMSKLMSMDRQKRLRNLLIGHFLDLKVTLVKKDIEELSVSISRAFPSEDPNTYYSSTTKTDPLYTDHNNKVQLLRKNNTLPQSTSQKSAKKRKLENHSSLGQGMCNYAPTDQELHSDELVRTNRHDIDFATLTQHWKLSSQIRNNKIQNLGPSDKLTSLFSEYSAFKKADGLMLVDIDFYKKYPLALESPVDKWDEICPILVEHINKEVKNDIVNRQIEKIGNINLSENQRSLLTTVGMHAILFSRKQVQHTAKGWKTTLPDAYKFMILHCKTENTLDIEIEKRRSLMMNHKATLQPLIAVFGDTLETATDIFSIVFEDIKYYKTNFVIALVEPLKIYETFNLAFPGPSHNVFQFFHINLLGLEIPNADSKVLSFNQIVRNKSQ